MLTGVSGAFVMPLLRTVARTRIRFHNIVDPTEWLPTNWEQPRGPVIVVVTATKGSPKLPPDAWAIAPWLSAWFRCAHILPAPVSTGDLYEAVNAALEEAMVQPFPSLPFGFYR